MVSGFFSEEKVSEVRERARILEVVSDYVTLKKTGRNYKGLCPFHSEKTPSFMVNEEKQIFHCFGCGEGGDVFTFLMKTGQFSFPQAVEELAKRYGVKLPPKELSPQQKKELAKRDLFFQINQAVSEYYHELLLHPKEGEEARRYLSQRGIREEVIEEHRLGYSLDRWDGLVRYLDGKKFPFETARELGLILPKKTGWYDAFRGRIIFPIFDLYQRVVGFGGRIMKEGEPKYLNSPESEVYHKGEILYGLHVAKREVGARDQVFLCEGYFDLLTLHQHGFKQSVATLGTALTPGHIRTLKRYTSNFVTLFDGDSAGIQATLRSLPLFLEEEAWGETVVLPSGEDPDGFLRKGGREAFEKMVEKRIPLIDFFLEGRMKSRNMGSIEEKVKVAREGLGLIRRIPEGIRRSFYLRRLSERLDLEESVLREMLGVRPKESGKEEGTSRIRGPEEIFSRSEEMVVSLMIHHPELIPAISEEGIVEVFESPRLKGLAEDLEGFFRKNGKLDLPEALKVVGEDFKERLCDFVFRREGPEGDPKKILRDCLQRIHEGRLKRDKKRLFERIREAEREKSREDLEALLMERQRLAERERALQAVRLREE
ncbi:MAG: DNA primase [Deltaproteobacteria bacterium]|nr:MAG: DNA primase [Deltaproteobacteria bacterium]